MFPAGRTHDWEPSLKSSATALDGGSSSGATRADIANAYRLFLARDPESDAVLSEMVGIDMPSLVRAFVGSPEFRANIVQPVLQGSPIDVQRFQSAFAPHLKPWILHYLEVSSLVRERVLHATSVPQLLAAYFADPVAARLSDGLQLGLSTEAISAALARLGHAATHLDVVTAYRAFLGREPESDTAAAEKVGATIDELGRGFLMSAEFQSEIVIPVLKGRFTEGVNSRASHVPARSREWVVNHFPLSDAARQRILTARTARQFLGDFFADPGIQSLYSEVQQGWTFADLLAALRDENQSATRTDGLSFVDPGEVALLCASDLFDADHYARAAGQVFETVQAAAAHYLRGGWRKGYDPSAAFDIRFYLTTNTDVRTADDEPLLHYLRHGQREKRRIRLGKLGSAPKPKAPAEAEWDRLVAEQTCAERLTSASHDTPASVDIIVPVYRGYDDTLACIHAALSGQNTTPFRLVVIDDRSPDALLSAKLSDLSASGLFELVVNVDNLGFVKSVNKGMALSASRDIVLLNSDTVVFGDWLDRLRAHAYSAPAIATVTPLSNNATIFSYPFANENNTQGLEVTLGELDEIISAANKDVKPVDVPTGVGFCMYVTRASLDALGLFDERLFGRGYGEENDFCCRAIEKGWRNMAAPDVLVAHTGEVSFAESSVVGKEISSRKLSAVHPRYHGFIDNFIRRDALRPARASIDIARFAKESRGRGVLMVEHGWGGGVERHILDLARLLDGDGIPTLTAKPDPSKQHLSLSSTLAFDYPNLPALSGDDPEEAAALLRKLDLALVHVHSVVGYPHALVRNLIAAARLAGLPLDVTIHDYTPVCPRLTMIDWSGAFCDSPSTRYCGICIGRAGSPFGAVDTDEWREEYRHLFSEARNILVPSTDLASRIATYFPNLQQIQVRPHPVPEQAAGRPLQPLGFGKPVTIGMIGAIGDHKGSRVLYALAADALLRKRPMRFVIYGYTNDARLGTLPNVTITGPYEENDIIRLFEADPCDLLFYASVCPETFSFSLDHAFRNGIFPVVFDLGAPAARVRSTGFGTVVPLSLIYRPERLNDVLFAASDRTRVNEPIVEPDRAWLGAGQYYSHHSPGDAHQA